MNDNKEKDISSQLIEVGIVNERQADFIKNFFSGMEGVTLSVEKDERNMPIIRADIRDENGVLYAGGTFNFEKCSMTNEGEIVTNQALKVSFHSDGGGVNKEGQIYNSSMNAQGSMIVSPDGRIHKFNEEIIDRHYDSDGKKIAPVDAAEINYGGFGVVNLETRYYTESSGLNEISDDIELSSDYKFSSQPYKKPIPEYIDNIDIHKGQEKNDSFGELEPIRRAIFQPLAVLKEIEDKSKNLSEESKKESVVKALKKDKFKKQHQKYKSMNPLQKLWYKISKKAVKENGIWIDKTYDTSEERMLDDMEEMNGRSM